MVSLVVHLVLGQQGGDLIDGLPAGTVDDGGPRELPVGHHLFQVGPDGSSLVFHFQVEVWSVEAGPGDLWRFQPEECADILLDVRRGGGGESHDGNAREERLDGAELTVGRSEVVAPLQ